MRSIQSTATRILFGGTLALVAFGFLMTNWAPFSSASTIG